MRAAMCTTVMRNGAGSRESNERQTCHPFMVWQHVRYCRFALVASSASLRFNQ